MSNKKYLIDRRTMLMGSVKGALGVSIGLPLLEVMFASDKAYAQALEELRFIHLYFEQGLVPGGSSSNWLPSGGTLPDQSSQLPTLLQFLNPNDFSIIGGTNNPTLRLLELRENGSSASGANEHNSGPIHALTGAPPIYMSANRGRESINNTIGRKLVAEGAASQATLAASLFAGNGYRQRGQDGMYATHTSWRTDGRNDERHTKPIDMLNALTLMNGECFGGGTTVAHLGKKSALDFVLGRVKKLRDVASANDKQTLDNYLDSFRDTEKSVNEGTQTVAPTCVGGVLTGDPRSQNNPTEFDKYRRDFAKVVALGLQSNKVRTMALQHAAETSATIYSNKIARSVYNNIQVPQIDLHIEVAHKMGNGNNRNYMIAYNRFQMLLARDIITELKTSGLFDTTMFLFGWSMGDAASHTPNNIPTFIAGGNKTGVRLKQNFNMRGVDHKKVLRAICQKFGITGNGLPVGLRRGVVQEANDGYSDAQVFDRIFG